MVAQSQSQVLKGVIALAALAVVAFTLIQLTKHGYDPPVENEHLVIDFDGGDGHNIASVSNVQYLQSQLNNFEQELHQQNEKMKELDSRLQKVESQSISKIAQPKTNPKQSETQTPTKSEGKTITNAPKAANQMKEEKEQSPSVEPQSTMKSDSGYTTPTDAILENPLNDPKCANALIEHENIDIESLIKEHHHQIPCTKRQETIPSIWTREAIGALTHHECYRPHTPLRTTNQQWDMINNQTAESAKEQGIDAPVYYHMPKCASSTMATMLKDLDPMFYQFWIDGPEQNHPKVFTNCGFTFVRNPVERFISGYYTINNMLWREVRDQNHRKTFQNHTVEKYDRYKFVRIIGEPERFEMYMEEMMSEPFHFGKTLPFRHTGSQMYFLSNWYGSDIQYFGRVERMEEHWNEMIQREGCHWMRDGMGLKEGEWMEVGNAMYHYGFYGETLYKKANGEKKEYVDALGMRENLNKMYGGKKNERVDADAILAPAYYFLTEEMYDKIVNYFWQDFVCFGYPTDYANFKKYVAQFVDPRDL